MQVSHDKYKHLLTLMAPAANLFLVLTLEELRRQGLTFVAFLVLQRVISNSKYSEAQLRSETGLPDYEVSRACTFLAQSGLIEKSRSEMDGRVRVLTTTRLGIKIRDRVISAAAKRMAGALAGAGEPRQVAEATEAFKKGNQTLLGSFQLSFFDIEDYQQALASRPRKKGAAAKRKSVSR